MERSVWRASAVAVLVLAGSPAAAQDAMPKPAAEGIEVELSVRGTIEVPAQGYRLGGLLFWDIVAPGDREAVESRVAELEIRDRIVCLPDYPIGFVSNEVFVDDAPMFDPSVAEGDGTGQPEALPAFDRLTSYSGLFATRAAAEEARALLKPRRKEALPLQPILFDCAEALDRARIAALAKSANEAEALAVAMGLRNAGVVRIEFADDDPGSAVISALRSGGASADTVAASVSIKATFRFER